PRQVDLGDDRDVALRRVGHDLAIGRLRQVTARSAADLAAPTDPGQLGPAVDLQAPALVVAEVQVHDIDLVQRDQIDEPFDVGRAEEVPGDVQHHAAPAEPRHVPHPHAGDGPIAGGHQLA